MCRCRPAVRRRLLVAALLLFLLVWALLRLRGAALPAVSRPGSLTPQSAPRPAGHSRSALLAVRTSGQLHSLRLPPLVSTWLRDTRPDVQIRLFSDTPSVKEFVKSLDGVGVEVNACGQSHTAAVLCCRLAHEVSAFLDTRHGWLCHFDDDNYVNTVAVEAMLASYNSRQPWYIGRARSAATYGRGTDTQSVRFAIGGAGFCISRAALMQAAKGILHGQFENSCRRLGLPDDVTLAYILWNSHRIRLTHIDEFHSHLEPLADLARDSLSYQISLSYSLQRQPPITVDVDGLDRERDPTRFISLHCLLHGVRQCS